jgi:multidrug efflux pump subunit AcrB
MSLLEPLLQRRRLVLTTGLLMAAAGLLSWFTMPREEDPRLASRVGMIITVYPGAEATAIERQVLEPLEDELGEVEAVKTISATARTGVLITNIQLRDATEGEEVIEAWADVEDAIDRAQREFPDGVLEPELTDDLMARQEGVVLAITGSEDLFELDDAAELVERRLLAIPTVSSIERIGAPDEQVVIELDDTEARRLGIDPLMLSSQLQSRNVTTPGGTLRVGERTVNVLPRGEFRDIDELRTTPIVLPSGAAVELGAVARVRRANSEPAKSLMRRNGQTAVGLGVIARSGIDTVSYGADVRAALADVAEEIAPLTVQEVTFQPDRVEGRLADLSESLLIGIGIVIAILFLAMGVRLGAVVGSIVPVVAFASLAVYAMGGGILHQISIAALVLALGLLVDNAIVMSEAIQVRIDSGMPRLEAALASTKELALPLGAATGTTLAAFVPMLMSAGPTGEFTRAIPVVIMLTIATSYVFAITFTPALASIILRPTVEPGAETRWSRFIGRVAPLVHARPVLVIVAAFGLVGGSGALAGFVPAQFFPEGDRNQIVVGLELPEGTHIEATNAAARTMEAALQERPDVVEVATFVGRSTPQFYYNLNRKPNAPHVAQIIVVTDSVQSVDAVQKWARTEGRRLVVDAEIEATKLAQGPPLVAPIEVRIYEDDLEELRESAEAVTRELRDISGAIEVRHDLGLGAPALEYEVDDAIAGRNRLAREQVALALLGETSGVPAGEYRADAEPQPIVIRSTAGERTPAQSLLTTDVNAPGQPAVPLAQVARESVSFRPASIRHRNRKRVATVTAQLEPGVAFSDVLATLEPALSNSPTLEANDSDWEFGGAAEGSGEANTAILMAAPIGLMLLLFFLLAEFNSFRRVGIILATVPLAATGVVPGLLIFGQPFGFMSLLGLLALVGIVVNNAIVLIDRIDSGRAEGLSLEDAVTDAVKVRARPILLTTATTVAGLLPLLVSNTTLWPPLASAMTSGLIASTLLTLAVVPSLYRILFGREARERKEALV